MTTRIQTTMAGKKSRYGQHRARSFWIRILTRLMKKVAVVVVVVAVVVVVVVVVRAVVVGCRDVHLKSVVRLCLDWRRSITDRRSVRQCTGAQATREGTAFTVGCSSHW
jgi:hypothetical protein